jgi:hypothetical protein
MTPLDSSTPHEETASEETASEVRARELKMARIVYVKGLPIDIGTSHGSPPLPLEQYLCIFAKDGMQTF